VQDNQTSDSHGSSKLSLARALCRYISLPNTFDQSAQLVPGGSSDTQDLSLERVCKGLNYDGLHYIKLLCTDKGQCQQCIENNHTKDF
jgi:hypothetical protein